MKTQNRNRIGCVVIRIPKRSKKRGLPPGTIVHVGEQRHERVKLSVIKYDGANFQEKAVDNVAEALAFRDKSSVTWLNIDGVHQPEIIEQVGKSFGLHLLVAEDIASTGQRPKMEDFDDYIFVVLRMLRFDDKENEAKTEQISMLLGPDSKRKK
jgi:magnesium transporter